MYSAMFMAFDKKKNAITKRGGIKNKTTSKSNRTIYNIFFFLFNYEWFNKGYFNQLDAGSLKEDKTSE